MSKQDSETAVAVLEGKTTQNLSMNANIDPHMMVALAVDTEEARLWQSRVKLETAIAECKVKQAAASKAAAAALRAQVEGTFTQTVQDLEKNLRDLGFNDAAAKIGSYTFHKEDDDTPARITVDLEITGETKRSYSSHANTISAQKTVTPNAEVLSANATVAALEAEMATLSKHHGDVRNAITNMGRVERRAKAVVSRRVMSASPEGRDMLAAIDSMKSPFSSVVDALPEAFRPNDTKQLAAGG